MYPELVLLAVLVSLALSAYFSGIEVGFYALNKPRALIRARNGDRRARAVDSCVADPERTIAVTVLGNNLVNYIASALLAGFWSRAGIDPYAGNLLVLTPIIFFLAEVVPKNLFALNADRLTYATIPLFQFFRLVLYPVARVLALFSELAGQDQPTRIPRGARIRSLIRIIMEESQQKGVLSPRQLSMAMNTLALREVPLRRVMIPVNRAVMLPKSASVDDLLEASRNNRYSRYPIYNGSERNIVGLVNVFDLFYRDSESPLDELIQPILKISDRLNLFEALAVLQKNKTRMCAVVDAKQQALGIVTVKDIVEEIVGELRDL